MAYWEWRPSYELGIKVIDNQHKRIVKYINELNDVFKTNDRNQIIVVFASITDYTVSHFRFEEQLMEEAGYAMMDSHKETHEKFIATVNKYRKSFNEGYDITGQLMAELQIWLTHHILNDDNDYKDCVKKMFSDKAVKRKEERTKAQKRGWFSILFRR
ncbi:MAG: bacteriohemerythrin [Campylobacteraceae bacterium]|jgi:hemerythrin|nr:bacteriohemerythrin [Campylobacteraceae bacterium]